MAEWIIQTIIVTVIGIISYFLKSYKTDLTQKDLQLKEEDEKLQKQIDQVEMDLNKYKLEAANKFVQKDDFIRASAQTDRKLDRIYDELMKMNKGNVEGKQ